MYLYNNNVFWRIVSLKVSLYWRVRRTFPPSGCCFSTLYVCMDVLSSHIARVRINRVRLPILLVVSRTGKINISLSPFAPENLVSRGTGSVVPSRVSLLGDHGLCFCHQLICDISINQSVKRSARRNNNHLWDGVDAACWG